MQSWSQIFLIGKRQIDGISFIVRYGVAACRGRGLGSVSMAKRVKTAGKKRDVSNGALLRVLQPMQTGMQTMQRAIHTMQGSIHALQKDMVFVRGDLKRIDQKVDNHLDMMMQEIVDVRRELIERIDQVDLKLTARIDAVDEKLTARIDMINIKTDRNMLTFMAEHRELEKR
jgi:hypothetical protein